MRKRFIALLLCAALWGATPDRHTGIFLGALAEEGMQDESGEQPEPAEQPEVVEQPAPAEQPETIEQPEPTEAPAPALEPEPTASIPPAESLPAETALPPQTETENAPATSAPAAAEPQPLILTTPPLVFEPTMLSGEDQWIHRRDADWSIRLENPNPYPVAYELDVQLDSAMAHSGANLLGGLMFVDGGRQARIGTNALSVASGIIEPESSVTLNWPREQGILFFLPGQESREAEYCASLLWSVRSDAAAQ